MKGLVPLFLGIFGKFAFSWLGLTVIPNAQIGHLDPQVSADDENDIYPMPPSGMAVRGHHVFVGNGCMYCHSEQMRPEYAGADVDRPRDAASPSPSPRPQWGSRRSAPRDYIFTRPVTLGEMRMGPDLANMANAAPAEKEDAAPSAASPAASASPAPAVEPEGEPIKPPAYTAAWHHRHLYSPRSVSPDSNMPAYQFLYQKRRISGQRSDDALTLTGLDAPPDGYEIVPTEDAKCLVAYLMSLNQSHPLKEVKPTGGAAPAPAAAAAAASASPAPKK